MDHDSPNSYPDKQTTTMPFGFRRKSPIAEAVQDNSVLHQLLKGRDTRWYAGDLLKINLVIVSCWTMAAKDGADLQMFLLITSMSNGYDGSMMNGLQTLENWREFFNNPTGGTLGLFNAIQVSFMSDCMEFD
jgi:hypothetical protein